MQNKILVTGATGFIGSHLVEALLKQKRKVKCLVLRNDSTLGEINNQRAEYLKNLGAEIFYGNLLDRKSLKEAIKDVDIIFHFGAIARPMAIPDYKYFEINAQGTENILEACKGKKIKKFIHMSSISAIGPSRDNNPVNEKTPAKPVDIYGESKLQAEKILFYHYKKYKVPIIILRPPMVFGERDFEMLRFFKAIKCRFFPLKGKGKMEFCYVKNLVNAAILAEKKGKIGEIYHINNGESYTINRIIKAISKEMKINLVTIPFPKDLVRAFGFGTEVVCKILGAHPPFSKETATWMTTNYWYSSSDKAKKNLGYKPIYTLEQGIKNTVNWYKKEKIL